MGCGQSSRKREGEASIVPAPTVEPTTTTTNTSTCQKLTDSKRDKGEYEMPATEEPSIVIKHVDEKTLYIRNGEVFKVEETASMKSKSKNKSKPRSKTLKTAIAKDSSNRAVAHVETQTPETACAH